MATQRDNEEFEDLLKVLAWKRHEQPPPGYFDSFSVKITARIESERHSLSWWQRFFAVMDPKPLYAGVFSITVCGTLLFGLLIQAKPHAGQAQLSMDELSSVWPQKEELKVKAMSASHGLAVYRGESSVTPVIDTDPFESAWKTARPSIMKASFTGF